MPESSQNNFFELSEAESAIREVLDSGGEFEFRPRGTSMLPLIKEGRDSVTIVKPRGRLKRGDVALYKRSNGKFVLHRVIRVLDTEYIMCGDNQVIPEQGITEEQIIAVVSKFRIDGILYTADSKKLIRYEKRRRNLILRRILLGIKRRIKNKTQS
jgi:hypothetical protein